MLHEGLGCRESTVAPRATLSAHATLQPERFCLIWSIYSSSPAYAAYACNSSYSLAL